jgi:hypothetical protein
MARRALIVWFLLLLVAVLNGAFREGALVPRFGPNVGHVLSSISLAVAILIVAYLSMPWIGPTTPSRALAVGFGWLGLTVLFEFGFGRARGRAWAELLRDYDVARGRIWVLVLLATLLAPWIVARFGGPRRRSETTMRPARTNP